MLDQAIAHGNGETNAEQVRAMLGLADRGRVLDLFDMIMRGQADKALQELSGQYADGADPLAILRDLAEITHWISVIKISPQTVDDPTVSPDERERGKAAASDLPMRAMTRMWQMLLKAIEEVSSAPNAMMAAEMAIIRLTHVADLPSPEELIKKIQNDPNPPVSVRNGPSVASNSENEVPQQKNIQISPNSSGAKLSNDGTIGVGVPRPQEEDPLHKYSEFNQVLELIRSHRDMKLLYDVETYVRVVKYLPGRLEFEPTKESPKDLAQRLGQKLQDWTKSRWAITLVNEGGGATIAEQKLEAKDDLHAKVSSHPLVKATLLAFPNSEIRNVNSINDMNIDEQILQEVPEEGDNWDPFEDN